MISSSFSPSLQVFLVAFFFVPSFSLAPSELPPEQVACEAAKFSCHTAPVHLRHAVCSACVKSCNACGKVSCIADGAICEKAVSSTKRRFIWSDKMNKCVALHHACINFNDSALARFEYCFECQSERGCFILCQGNKWCGSNVAHCLQSMEPPH